MKFLFMLMVAMAIGFVVAPFGEARADPLDDTTNLTNPYFQTNMTDLGVTHAGPAVMAELALTASSTSTQDESGLSAHLVDMNSTAAAWQGILQEDMALCAGMRPAGRLEMKALSIDVAKSSNHNRTVAYPLLL